MTDEIAHTDHPLRHWDRTCPACQISELRGQLALMTILLLRLEDSVEALDGTSVENEKLVDDYRKLMGHYK
jgi:hypothetical protein